MIKKKKKAGLTSWHAGPILCSEIYMHHFSHSLQLFFFFNFWVIPHSIWSLSSLARDWTCTPRTPLESGVLSTGPLRKSSIPYNSWSYYNTHLTDEGSRPRDDKIDAQVDDPDFSDSKMILWTSQWCWNVCYLCCIASILMPYFSHPPMEPTHFVEEKPSGVLLCQRPPRAKECNSPWSGKLASWFGLLRRWAAWSGLGKAATWVHR